MSSAAVEARSEDLAQRLSRARAALGAAERSAARWGGRIDRTALRGPSLQPSPGEGAAEEADDGLGARLPLPGPLAPLVPRGTLRAGSSVAVEGAATTSLLLSLAVAAAGDDAWCAVAGMPDLGLRAALDAGLDPTRLALAPADGDQTPQVLSALADGVGVLVLGPDLALAPALWRSLLGRARTADTLVLAATPPGRADLTLRASGRGWTGLSTGSGRLRRRRLAVTSQGRGIAGHREVEVLLPEVRGLLAAVPQGGAAVQDIPRQGADRPADLPAQRPMRLVPTARRAG